MRNVIKKHEYFIYGIVFLEILLLTYFTYKYGVHHIDTDDSAEMVLAQFLNQKGALMSREWYYSTEIRVLNTQIVMAPLFSLLQAGENWKDSNMASSSITMAIFIGLL